MRVISLVLKFQDARTTLHAFSIVVSLFGMWGFYFVRLLYTPFCIHPDMTTLQALALDYLIAVYPLFLLLLVYLIVKLHSRSFKPTVYLWNVVRPMAMFLRSKLKIEFSLVHSFATVFLLSSIKVQSITFDLLIFTKIFYSNGSSDGKL